MAHLKYPQALPEYVLCVKHRYNTTYYKVMSMCFQTAGAYKWQQVNIGERVTEPSYKVTGLEADYEYEFRVAAENKAGVGDFSQSTTPTVAKDRTVGNMPEILLPLSDVTATAGKTLVIECDVTAGNPPAKFKW